MARLAAWCAPGVFILACSRAVNALAVRRKLALAVISGLVQRPKWLLIVITQHHPCSHADVTPAGYRKQNEQDDAPRPSTHFAANCPRSSVRPMMKQRRRRRMEIQLQQCRRTFIGALRNSAQGPKSRQPTAPRLLAAALAGRLVAPKSIQAADGDLRSAARAHPRWRRFYVDICLATRGRTIDCVPLSKCENEGHGAHQARST